jgi:tetratricopeptide (TPR) repeat protein
METYRLSSKLRDKNREYLIQTANDSHVSSVATSIYVDGNLTETINCPHPNDIQPEAVLSLVKQTHADKKKEIETLLQTYRKVIETGNPEAMYHLGTAFFYKGFNHEARELLQTAVSLRPDHHQSFNQLGLTELALGNHSEAIKAATQAVTRRPRFADYRNNLGEAFLCSGDIRGAVVQFEEAISINLYYADAYCNLGLAHLSTGISGKNAQHAQTIAAKASDCFHKASLIDPGFRGQEFDSAIAAIKELIFERAFVIIEGIRETRKEIRRREFAGFYLKFILFPESVSEKILQDRITFLQNEINRNPSYVDLHVELARCFLEQGVLFWQKGLEHYHMSVEMNQSLTNIRETNHRAETLYKEMRTLIDSISEKG